MLELIKKLPLGGVDRRAMVEALARDGLRVATAQLDREYAHLRKAAHSPQQDTAVIILGGSNGITRAIAIQLLFAQGIDVFCVHFDSEKMQIGIHHAKAISELAQKLGRNVHFLNEDATHHATIEHVIDLVKGKYRAVHLINGIAAGATKRYPEFGKALVPDIDVAFDLVLQTPDYSKPENIRRVGMVEVDVATELDIERTNRFMGTSTLLWVTPLAKASLIAPGESVIAFCDYDFEPNDPVYAMGPLAGAKKIQREQMVLVRTQYGAIATRICYPPAGTTALGAIPGGLLMYGLSAQILRERSGFQSIPDLAYATMLLWQNPAETLRLDSAYQACLPEFHVRKNQLNSDNLHDSFRLLYDTSRE